MAKNKLKQKVRCLDCKKATLMQWNKDPVIVQCPNLTYRDVASPLRFCDDFRKREGEPEIKHFKY